MILDRGLLVSGPPCTAVPPQKVAGLMGLSADGFIDNYHSNYAPINNEMRNNGFIDATVQNRS